MLLEHSRHPASKCIICKHAKVPFTFLFRDAFWREVYYLPQIDREYWCEPTIAESPVTQFISQMVCQLITITIVEIHVCLIFMCKNGHNFAYAMTAYVCRDHFVYVHSQWEMMLQCNIISHWLGTCTKWSLYLVSWHVQNCDLLL